MISNRSITSVSLGINSRNWPSIRKSALLMAKLTTSSLWVPTTAVRQYHLSLLALWQINKEFFLSFVLFMLTKTGEVVQTGYGLQLRCWARELSTLLRPQGATTSNPLSCNHPVSRLYIVFLRKVANFQFIFSFYWKKTSSIGQSEAHRRCAGQHSR